MNNTQLTGMRNLYAANLNESYTAKGMALKSHNLSKDGMTAITDGKKFLWSIENERREGY